MGANQTKHITNSLPPLPPADYSAYDAKQSQGKFVLLNDPRADANVISITFTFLGRCDFLRASQCCRAMHKIGGWRSSLQNSSSSIDDRTIASVFQSAAVDWSQQSTGLEPIYYTPPIAQLRVDATTSDGAISRYAKNPLLAHITSVHLLAYDLIARWNPDEKSAHSQRIEQEISSLCAQFLHLDTLHLSWQQETSVDVMKCLPEIAQKLRVLTLPTNSFAMKTVLGVTNLISLLINIRVLTLPTTEGLGVGVLLQLKQLQALCIRNIQQNGQLTIMSDIRQLSLEHELRSLSLPLCSSWLLCPLFQTRAQAASGLLQKEQMQLVNLYDFEGQLDPELFCIDQSPNFTNLHCYGALQGLVHRIPSVTHLTMHSVSLQLLFSSHQRSHLLSLTLTISLTIASLLSIFYCFPELPVLQTLDLTIPLSGAGHDDTEYVESMLLCVPSLTDLTLNTSTVTRWSDLQDCFHLQRFKLTLHQKITGSWFEDLCRILGEMDEFMTLELVLSGKWRKAMYVSNLAVAGGKKSKEKNNEDAILPTLAPFELPPSFVPSFCSSKTWRTLHVSVEHLHPRVIQSMQARFDRYERESMTGEMRWSPSMGEENIPPLQDILLAGEGNKQARKQKRARRQMERFRIYSYHPTPDGNKDIHDCYGLVPLAAKGDLNKIAAAPSSSSSPAVAIDRVGWRQHAMIV